MNEHPSNFALEAYFVGEADPVIADHIQHCEHCQRRLAELGLIRSADLDAEPPAAFFERPAMQAAFSEQGGARTRSGFGRWFVWLVGTGIAVAAAAIIWATPQVQPTGQVADQVLMKGAAMTVSVVRDRRGTQSSHETRVPVRPGDRLRIQVRLTHPMRLSAGILTSDQQWLALTSDTPYLAGTHFLHEDALVIDQNPTRGELIVGSPEAVAEGRRTGRYLNVERVLIGDTL
ncbi:MAG: hypothetical protein VX589_11970 [Myxococcota bacterium]|nr:hypothetical protein [Myxococcota bacterium]